ncbi:MAG: dTDP-4-dehydrorhamnose 3,5-epimerase [Pseudobutyrivibrio sp.]|nr:dTDP-4-dehydrorhamnose 3,5-epimerase [Pseudobutyrivibrio sp.]
MNKVIKAINGFEFEKLKLIDSYIIRNFNIKDNRGSFEKCFEKSIYLEGGIPFNISEIFCSVSDKNVIRGIHFQTNNPQAKLVTVLSGSVMDYIVDLRPTSKTFKQWISVELSADNCKALYVPRGFGHGFCSMMDNTTMLYMCDGVYDKETDTGIRYDDLDLGIKWPELENEIHSERDLKLMSFNEYILNPIELG